MMKKITIFILLLIPTFVFAQTWQASSGEKQIPVVELFTSEGCGACPPADRWAKQLPELGFTDDKVVVLGFHIDYLNDRKGWVDRFAKPAFSDRQRQLVLLNLYKTVFTPQIIISGETVHAWEHHGNKIIEAITDFEAEADISLAVNQTPVSYQVAATTTVRGDANKAHSKLYLAITEDDISNTAFGGDNRGTTFNHQNLVRIWLGPFDLNTTGDTVTTTEITIDPEWNREKLTVVALVQNLDDGFVLQALPVSLVE